ncbi:MAG: RNA polymerase sigma factor [Sphingomonas sp.]
MVTLDQVIRTHGPALARVAASYEADRALQEDLLQDILFAVHRALPALVDATRLAPFVFRIAHNRGVSHVVRESGTKRRARAADEPEPPPDPERQLIAEDRVRRLAAAVRRLPLPYRQVMTLLLEEMSHAEIAETLGLTATNVAVRVNRAKAQLRTMLDDGR